MSHEAIELLRKRKEAMTLDQLGKVLDVPVGTVQRWLKTGRINKLYAAHVVQVLKGQG